MGSESSEMATRLLAVLLVGVACLALGLPEVLQMQDPAQHAEALLPEDEAQLSALEQVREDQFNTLTLLEEEAANLDKPNKQEPNEKTHDETKKVESPKDKKSDVKNDKKEKEPEKKGKEKPAEQKSEKKKEEEEEKEPEEQKSEKKEEEEEEPEEQKSEKKEEEEEEEEEKPEEQKSEKKEEEEQKKDAPKAEVQAPKAEVQAPKAEATPAPDTHLENENNQLRKELDEKDKLVEDLRKEVKTRLAELKKAKKLARMGEKIVALPDLGSMSVEELKDLDKKLSVQIDHTNHVIKHVDTTHLNDMTIAQLEAQDEQLKVAISESKTQPWATPPRN